MAVSYKTISTTGWQGTTSLSITKPTGLVTGDLMIACIYGNTNTSSPTTPSGWDKIIALTEGSCVMLIYKKIATDVDVAASNFTWSWGISNNVYGVIYAFSDALDVSVYDSEENTNSTNDTRTFSGITVTPTKTNSNLVAFFGGDGIGSSKSISSYAVANNNPGTWNELVDSYESVQDLLFGTAYAAYSPTSATGALTVVTSGDHESNDDFFGALLVVDRAIVVPTITTDEVSNIDITTATGGGNVTDDGGGTITQRGICWNTATAPTVSNSKTIVSGTTGTFEADITGLESGTLYYVRSFATNSAGTTYGNEVTFTSASVASNSLYKDIDGVDGATYAVQLYIGGTTGTLTVKLGSTGDSEVFNAGAGTVTLQGVYGGLNGLIFEASGTFDGYIDDVYHVIVLGDVAINWASDSLVNIFPINSSVLFKRIENEDFNKFNIYRYIDVQFKDLDAYVTVLLKNEANENVANTSKEFLVSNESGSTLPFTNKKISTLQKSQAILIQFSNNRLDERFTLCQFVVKGYQVPRTFRGGKVISM
jgi:hypothetical protein